MNRYPVWKYVVIALAVLISAIYAAPNLFGEIPAVQDRKSTRLNSSHP